MAAKHPGSRLRRFRLQLGLGIREAARQLHVSHPPLMQWEDGERVPSPPYRDAIEVWTHGAVKATDWPLSEQEQTASENAALVRPAVKTGTEG